MKSPVNTAPTAPANTPFPDIVVLFADAPQELHAKIRYYLTQGYKVTGAPTRFEDITIDIEAIGRPNIQLPKATVAGAILMRNDPT